MATRIPTWDTADRMKKALREADLGVQEIAEYLGVSRNTVSTWINGRIEPSKQTLRLWAMKTGVPFDWLTDEADPSGRGGHRRRAGPGFRTSRFRSLRTRAA